MKRFLFWVLPFLGLLGCTAGEPPQQNASPLSEVARSAVDSILATRPWEEWQAMRLVLRLSGDQHKVRPALLQAVAAGHLGGVLLEDFELTAYLRLQDSLRALGPLPLFNLTQATGLLQEQFTDLDSAPGIHTWPSELSDTLRRPLEMIRNQQLQALRVNLPVQFTLRAASAMHIPDRVEAMHNAGLLAMAKVDSIFLGHLRAGESGPVDSLIDPYRPFFDAGLSALYLDSSAISASVGAPPGWLRNRLSQAFDFDGLLVAEWSGELAMEPIEADALVVDSATWGKAREWLQEQRQPAGVRQRAHMRRIIRAKCWLDRSVATPADKRNPVQAIQAALMGGGQPTAGRELLRPNIHDRVIQHFESRHWTMVRHQLYERNTILLLNKAGFLPIGNTHTHRFELLPLGADFNAFQKAFRQYASFRLLEPAPNGRLPVVSGANKTVGVLVGPTYPIDSNLINWLDTLAADHRPVVIHFGVHERLQRLAEVPVLIQGADTDDGAQTYLVDALFGGRAFTGKLRADNGNGWLSGSGLLTTPDRLAYTSSLEVGIAPERLIGIDAIVRSAIDAGATPGAQVLVAKSGKIIYHKAFGHHDYTRRERVGLDDVYDLASLTKMLATTLSVMKLEEQGAIDINDPLDAYLNLDDSATVGDIRIRELLTHRSGLQPHFPVGNMLFYRDSINNGCDSIFCREKTDTFPTRVAARFFLRAGYQDSIRLAVSRLPLREARFRYSDVNFYLLQQVIEAQTGQGLDRFARRNFYRPLGLVTMGYLPLDHLRSRQIVPTELDASWRRQVLHGDVHDEAAALLGGVGGHAGLFGNTYAVGVIGQMLLQQGRYGGITCFRTETVREFTRTQPGTKRGLGFDKPNRYNAKYRAYQASPATFGHLGFTGTSVWIDPSAELVFVFLSNRVHPSRKNRKLQARRVRSRAHQIVYDALDSYRFEWPYLEEV